VQSALEIIMEIFQVITSYLKEPLFINFASRALVHTAGGTGLRLVSGTDGV